MNDLPEVCFPPDATIREILQALDRTGLKVIVVVDANRRVLGMCTDGDIRRALLRDVALTSPVSTIMNASPILATTKDTHADILAQMRQHNVLNIPVVDQDDHFISLVSRYQTERNVFADVAVVLMVGGLGKRLHPLTENCPKPMLPVGGRPLLERIIGRFRDQGFRNFFLSINYLGHQIEEHFGTGAAFGVSIAYLREDMKLGTAGALSLLPSSVQGPMIVMNGDVITELDFRKLVDFHKRSGFAATMCTREHRTAIPFGVVEHDVSRFAGITEKPTIVHQINAGVYCVEADCARIVPQGKFYDMPDLFADLHEKGHGCGIYKISDHWVDIGNLQDYERANSMFANVPSDT